VARELTDSEVELLHCDLIRSVNWFSSLSDNPIDSAHAVERAIHIFRLLILHDNFSYYQGADRFLWICHLVALAGTSAETAEAVAFYLTKATLDIATEHGFPNTRALVADLQILDHQLERDAPMVAAELAAFYYASRWVLLWFADEHDRDGIFAIWDNVIGVIGRDPRDLRKYLYALALAHAAAVPVPTDGMPMLQAIQQYRNWDVGQILASARIKKNSLWEYRWVITGLVVAGIGIGNLKRGQKADPWNNSHKT
jgi:hypothetical protein